MRFFDRSQMERPKMLDSTRVRAALDEVMSYLGLEDQKMISQRRMRIDTDLLNHPDITGAVFEGFGEICAYCETPASTSGLGVGHHRPLGGAADESGATSQLHYVWLAYEWENLLPVCAACNRHKGNRFWVMGERGRLRASIRELRGDGENSRSLTSSMVGDPVRMEHALLLDPTFDGIADELQFLPGGTAFAAGKRGAATIEMLGLNRADLVSARKQAMRFMASILLKDLEHVEAIPTGAEHGWASYLIGFDNSLILPHRGAVTLALMRQANEWLPGNSTLPVMLGLLEKLEGSERYDLLRPFLEDEAQTGSTAPPPPAPAKRPRKPSRTVRKQDLPAAELPLEKVTISNFKALAGIEFELPSQTQDLRRVPCMLILGENATGKSSVLEAIAMALLGTGEVAELDKLLDDETITPSEFQHRPDFDNWDVLATDPLQVSVSFLGQEQGAYLEGGGKQCHFGGSLAPSKILLAYGPRRFFVKRTSRRYRAPAWRVRSLFDPMMVIPNPIQWLLELDDEKKFDAAVRALRVVLMLDDDAKILRDGERILIDTPQGSTPLSKMSVGYKSIVALSVDIIRELFHHYDNLEDAHGVVLVDEIETHLHPRWKMQIVGLLREAFPKVQFILTTHDPLCLRGMQQGEVFVLQRNEDNARVETLEELPNVQGMRAEQILTSEFFGLGSTDPETDAKVERYHFLAKKVGRTAAEEDERKTLVAQIDKRMMVGTTMEEQVNAAALSVISEGTEIDTLPLAPVRDGDRKRMMKQALSGLLSD
ncbi:AAA family ATPase [Alteraurantiacibacter aestuarii]|uniref:AAA family ATPase n=1 Tax=Alteraurantiacibacter aestuarii TaxID=650004 RepID=A0A844ZKI8_9SPHN|nr:AAA family ATPase [Alteraurantiacibacter aestuarii]MXO88043.1 AAA family ATPase [Alteraurantiacibacter aestuarii]